MDLKPKTNVLVWIIGGLILLSAGVGIGLFLARNIYPPLQILPTPTATTDPTTNWKTHTNIKYGYQIKYPNDWKSTETDDPGRKDGPLAYTTIVRDSMQLNDSGFINISIGQKLTWNQFIKNAKQQGFQNYKFNGQDAMIFKKDGYDTSIKLNSPVDKLIIVTYGYSHDNSDKETVDQILSTFKFTSETSVDFRKERMLTANRQGQQNQCYAAIYETTRSICKSQTGFDPGSADGSGVKDWITLTNEEKAQEVLFWQCYDRVSASEIQKCESEFPDVTKKRNAYYDCLAEGVDVGKYCGDTTEYTQANSFPKDAESEYWQCMEVTRIEKETKCATKTGYNPN